MTSVYWLVRVNAFDQDMLLNMTLDWKKGEYQFQSAFRCRERMSEAVWFHLMVHGL